MNINSAVKLAVCAIMVLPELVISICTGLEYWNPVNNACVDCNIILMLECPWHHPHLYYADPSTNACVTKCPTTPSYYANDLTQKCVTSNQKNI